MNKSKHSEIISQLIVESAPSSMILMKKDGEITFANNETERLFGYDRNELIGQSIEIIIPKERYPDSHNMFLGAPQRQVLGAGKEILALRKDGTEVPVEIGLSLLVTTENTLTLAVFIDITDRKKKEITLTNSEKRFREFFENAPEAVVILDPSSGTFVKNNTNALKLFKFSNDELGKMGLADISPEFQPDGDRSDEKANKYIEKALDGARTFFEWAILDAEGNEVLCEVRIVALPDIKERQLLASFVDIAERKTAEHALRADNKRLRFRLENSLLGFIEWDDKLHIKSWSKRAEEIFGWTQEEFIAQQKDGYSLVYEEDFPAVSKLGLQLLNGEVNRNSTLQRNYTKDKQVIWCEWFHSVLKDEDGKVVTIMSLVLDVTERRAAENEIRELNEHLEDHVSERTAELTEANKELEAFSYSVSHDLRAPLRAIVGFTNIIQEEYGPSLMPDMKELFAHIESNGNRMSIIIDDLLTLARYGKEKLRISPVDMTKLFKRVWANIKRTSPNNTPLEIPTLPTVEADISMMEQVLVNLLSNAIKYSSKKDHPIVQVGFKEDATAVTFFIKDNGVGFDMAYYDRLFGAFQRLHGISEFEGTGVGLLLAKRIIEKHGGTIWAEAKVGEGATFSFCLPKATVEQNTV